MNMIFLVIAMVFVFTVLGLVAYSIFAVTPYARHKDHYRDPDTGERRFSSPRLD